MNVPNVSQPIINAYYDGVLEGLWKYAHWKDGTQYVGTMGTTLKEAQDKANADRAKYLKAENEQNNS